MIELCIVLMIAGLTLTTFLAVTQENSEFIKRKKTTEAIENIHKKIAIYYKKNFKLPCPAPLSIGSDIYDYNQKYDCEKTYTDVVKEDDDYIYSKKDDDIVVHGKIPYKELNLSPDQIEDGWGKILYYSVTTKLTNGDNYEDRNGVISIINNNGESMIEKGRGAQYILYSLGVHSELDREDCSSDEVIEHENCNIDNVFRYAELSQGQEYFDDIISYKVDIDIPEYVGENCDLLSFLERNYDIDPDFVYRKVKDKYSINMYPGTIATLCVPEIIEKMGFENLQCAVFFCREDGIIRETKIIQ